MTDVTLRSIQMIYVNQAVSSRNHAKYSRAVLRNGSNNDCEIFVKFALPGGFAKYSNMKFRIYAAAAVANSTYVLEALTAGFDFSGSKGIKWSNRPGSTVTNRVTVTKSTGKNGYVEFDVTNILNDATAAGKFYGFRIYMSSTNGTANPFYTTKASSKYGPVLSGTYTTAPRKPSNLNPSGGRHISVAKPIMTADFLDRAGSTLLSKVRVQIHSSSNFTTPDFDSQWFNTGSPQIDLNNFSYSIANQNVDYYWRMNQMDGDGNESGWSDIAVFRRGAAKVPATLISPAASPNNIVEDATPTVLWSSTNQKDFQLLLWNQDKTVMLANTGKITAADQDYEIGVAAFTKGATLLENVDYVLELRIWDSVLRATLSNDPAYSSTELVFRYVPSATVSPTTDLKVTQIGKTPWVTLEWQRGQTPDAFDVFRDGVMIRQGLSPEDVYVVGTTYRWVDKMAAPRMGHTWEVKAKSNGKQSANNSKVTKQIDAVTAFLAIDDSDIIIPFLNYSADITRADGSFIVDVLNSDESLTVYQGQATRRGEFTGLISGEVRHHLTAKTARDYKNELFSLSEAENHGRICFLSWADELIAVAVSQIDDSPTVYNEEICYVAKFYVTERKRVMQS